ncbi:MAG: hypothetical protein AB7O66_02305 [Limisphaerales bacterium]
MKLNETTETIEKALEERKPVGESGVGADADTGFGSGLSQGEMPLGVGRGVPSPAHRRRVVRTRRSAVARWWFARMRETVRATRDWDAGASRSEGSRQGTLALVQPPTRFEGYRGGGAEAFRVAQNALVRDMDPR